MTTGTKFHSKSWDDLANITLPVDYNSLTPVNRRLVRDEYVRRQNNKCLVCKVSLGEKPIQYYSVNKRLFPKGFFRHPVHLHHNHKTGMTIGAVHAYCNAFLWQYRGE